MAIDIQQPNYSGLAAIAGKNAGLNIQATGALGLQGLQQRQAADAALREEAFKRMQLQQQGQAGLLSNMTSNRALDIQAAGQNNQAAMAQQQLAFEQQKAATQGDQFNQTMGYQEKVLAQQGMGTSASLEQKYQEMAMKAAEAQMAALKEEKAESIKEKGAFAAYGVLSMQSAKTPAEKEQVRNEMLKEAADKKYLTPEELKLAAQMPLSQFENSLKYKIMQYGAADDYKKVNDTGKQAGAQTITLADGTVIQTSAPTTANQGKVQDDLGAAKDNIRELTNLYKNVKPDYFGAAALKYDAINAGELGKDIPVIGKYIDPSDKSKKDYTQFSDIKAGSEMMTMNIIKQLSGLSYTDKQLEFLRQITPQIGKEVTKSQFDGKVENLQRFFNSVKAAREKTLAGGYEISSDPNSPYAQKLLDNMQIMSLPVGSSTADKLKLLKNPDGSRRYTDEQINAALKGK